MSSDRFVQLTESQRESLRLVYSMHSSKEIAVRLGVSPSAVDKRLERAVQTLSATSRFEAARMLTEHERPGMSEWTTSDAIDVPQPTFAGASEPLDGSLGTVRRLLGLGSGTNEGGRRNRLTARERFVVILLLMFVVAISAMALLNIGQTLTRIVDG